MPQTRINCPNCRQPITADINQLFDNSADPQAKQMLLSGAFNLAQCPSCGYQGQIATPLVYHDAQKELLLTFVPPELNIPRNDQERLLGQVINQVVNRLPQDQRKGYLLRPRATLTLQGLIESILEADGITKEMLQAQQKRLQLIQRLATVSDDGVLAEIAKQENTLMDRDFFAIFSRLVESSMMSGDREGASRLSELQQKLLPLSTAGREILNQSKEVEAAVKELQEVGRDLTREKMLEMVLKSESETRLSVFASLARPLMDYQFFQLLSERIDKAAAADRQRLVDIRENLLNMTREVDQQLAERDQMAHRNLETLLQQPNIAEVTQANLGAIDEYFVRVLNDEINAAGTKGDLERLGKLQQIAGVLEKASAPPPELELLEELLDLDTDEARQLWLDSHPDVITPEFMDLVTSFISQPQASEDPELRNRLQQVYRSVMKFSMQQNLKK